MAAAERAEWGVSGLVVLVVLVVAVTLVLALVLLVRLVRTRRELRAAGVPVERMPAFWVAVVYLLSPVDLLPDPVLIDDVAVLLLALRSMRRAVPEKQLTPRR